MESDYKKIYQEWLDSPEIDLDTKKELLSWSDNDSAVQSAFLGYLEFGTAGLRGIMRAGINSMNIYTVRHATQGFADYINACGGKSVVIACDSRLNSQLFSQEAAAVLAANGIKTYIFDYPRPTPELSFALRYLGCIAGINITASHNPKEYNGYKAYWADGAQLSPEQASEVSSYITSTNIFTGIKTCSYNKAVSEKMITIIGREIDEAYINSVLSARINPAITKENFPKKPKIVYTPLYGAGMHIIPEVLSKAGYDKLYTVAEQMIFDGSFPSTPKPNPEYAEVYKSALKKAEEVGASLIIATDPDCDRLGMMTKNRSGSWERLTGNRIGVLLLGYITDALKDSGKMPENPYVIKTIVSTPLADAICSACGITCFNVLTGFKNIGAVIENNIKNNPNGFLFGFEESNGYLRGCHARDKDGVVASLILCEALMYYHARSMTLSEALYDIYRRYGYYYEETRDITMNGIDPEAQKNAFMSSLRDNPPKSIGGLHVLRLRDYKNDVIYDKTGASDPTKTGLPLSDVLYYELENDCALVIRPSGTEPKAKIYLLVHTDNYYSAKRLADSIKSEITAL